MKVLVLFSVLLIQSISFGQDTGLYGKKFTVEVSASGSFPMLAYLLGQTDMNFVEGSELVTRNDRFDYSFRGAASYVLKNDFAVGFEFSSEYSNVEGPREIRNLNTGGAITYTPILHENYRIRTFVFMPRVEFTNKMGLLPIGFSHQFGIGFTTTEIMEEEYVYSVVPPYSTVPESQVNNYFKNSLKGLSMVYTINMRTPINKFMMLTYGFRYNLNAVPNDKFGNDFPFKESSHFTHEDVLASIRKRRIFSILSFNVGVAFAF